MMLCTVHKRNLGVLVNCVNLYQIGIGQTVKLKSGRVGDAKSHFFIKATTLHAN